MCDQSRIEFEVRYRNPNVRSQPPKMQPEIEDMRAKWARMLKKVNRYDVAKIRILNTVLGEMRPGLAWIMKIKYIYFER